MTPFLTVAPWIVITIGAAFLQNIRSALQRHLKGRLGASGATFVRFVYGIPAALAIVSVLHWGVGMAWPSPDARFAFWVVVAALGQIVAQFLLIVAFGHRNFTVATAYSRTEPLHAALFGFLVLGDRLGVGDAFAIALTVAGVAVISVARTTLTAGNLARSLVSPGALIGLASGVVFGLTAVAYRTASLALEGPGTLMQASFTLVSAILFQSIVMVAVMAWRNPSELRAVFIAWRPGLMVGLVGATASFGWFSAMTLQQAAIVKALAQIEMLFTYGASVFIFREHVNGREIAGCLLIVTGIVALLVL